MVAKQKQAKTTHADVELRNVTKVFGTRSGDVVRAVDDVSLRIEDGEFFALLGPSGCGKTTTLRMIAGFEDTSIGEILIRGEAVQKIPPFHRPVNTVFQDYALFPHMSVLQNVMFGLQMEKVGRQEAKRRAEEALAMVQLPHASDRKPGQLSGGQQQRVALARALVKQPAVLLLDEPLGALDLKLRKAMQFELKSMQQQLGITFIYVTHDQEEALTMADRIAVMSDGKALQVGSPSEIYEKPNSRFVADFIGETNFITGELVAANNNLATVKFSEDDMVFAMTGDEALPVGNTVTVAVRPEKIGLFPKAGIIRHGDAEKISAEKLETTLSQDNITNLLSGVVKQAIYIGTDTRYVVRIADRADVVVRVQNFGQHFDTTVREGEEVNLYWEYESARVLLQ